MNKSCTSACDSEKAPQPIAWTTRKPRNQLYSLDAAHPIAPIAARAIPPSNSFLRPHMSDSGPTSITENARLTANRLTDKATSGGDIWK
ncbi:hypothetical protein D3C87_1327050 [compost metagenome]